MNIRVAAIAKDEGAYFPEWIFHHLHFGITSIEIYVNRTSDNSYDVLRKITERHKNISVINADEIVSHAGANFQHQAYSDALAKARNESVDYLFFLDIDEFWTPLNFKTNLPDFIRGLGCPEIISFEWGIPSGDEGLFAQPFKTTQYISKDRHVKTIFKTSLDITRIHVHNIEAENSKYILANGALFENDDNNKYCVSNDQLSGDLKDAFVLHRVTRSQIEYISLLGRGRPSSANDIKNNRWGYIPLNKNAIKYSIDDAAIDHYLNGFSAFIRDCDLLSDLITSKEFVLTRFSHLIKAIVGSKSFTEDGLKNLFKNIDLLSIKLLINYIAIRDQIDGAKEEDINSLKNVLAANCTSTLGDFVIKKYICNKLSSQNIDSILDEAISIDLQGVDGCQ